MKRKSEESAKAAAAWMAKANASPAKSKVPKADRERNNGESFKRVASEVWEKEVIHGLDDNSYDKVFGEDSYGKKASDKLIVTRGKGFRHEKTKAKRGAYRGGTIDMSAATKSFKYED
jgi:hypothetical protein